MRPLDMTPHRPYRPMAQTCHTRPLADKQVLWVHPAPRLHPQGRFLGRTLRQADVGAAAELWRASYPEVYGSVHDYLLYPEDYPERMALEETWEADTRGKPHCMLVVEEIDTGRLVAASLMTKCDRNLQIEYSFAGTHPEFRRYGLMKLLGKMMYDMTLASGAEYLTTFLETWHTITQHETLKWGRGWKVAGIFPGNFTRWAGGQEEYRACEIHLYQFIRGGDRYATQPEEWHLHPKLLPIWNALEDLNRELEHTSTTPEDASHD